MTRNYHAETAASVTALARRIMNINLCKEIMLDDGFTGYVYAPYIPRNSIRNIKMIPKSKYQFSRAKWYTADVSWNNYREVMEWCTEQFGPRPKVSDAWTRWFDNHGDRIFFRDLKDYNWFVLRWSHGN